MLFRFSQAQNSSPAFPLAYKNASTACVCPANKASRSGVVKLIKSSCGAFRFSCFSLCLVHFLAIVNNITICQITSLHAFRFGCFPCVLIRLRLSFPLLPVASCICVQSYNLYTSKPNIFEKKLR